MASGKDLRTEVVPHPNPVLRALGLRKTAAIPFYRQEPKWVAHRTKFEALGIDEATLAKVFGHFGTTLHADVDGSGFLGIRALLEELGVDPTPFAIDVFTVEDGDQSIDFREFTEQLWEFCTLHQRTIPKQIFGRYNTSDTSAGTGAIGKVELYGLLTDMHAGGFPSKREP